MKTYIKTIDGIRVIKPADKIIVTKEGIDTFCPTEEMILEDGWEEYVEPVYETTDEELLSNMKERIIKEIISYDSSDAVNVFYIGECRFWFDKMERIGLKLRFDSELKSGKSTTTLWSDGRAFEFEISYLIDILTDVEVYASACYDITQKHVAKVKLLSNIESVKSYNYRIGYPEILMFKS